MSSWNYRIKCKVFILGLKDFHSHFSTWFFSIIYNYSFLWPCKPFGPNPMPLVWNVLLKYYFRFHEWTLNFLDKCQNLCTWHWQPTIQGSKNAVLKSLWYCLYQRPSCENKITQTNKTLRRLPEGQIVHLFFHRSLNLPLRSC